MKKYAWLLAIVLLVTLSLLAACGGETTAPEPAPGPAPAPAPTPTPTTTPTPTPTPTATGAPAGEATAIPADHARRSNDLCVTCHKPAG
jgi:hypothetical protein